MYKNNSGLIANKQVSIKMNILTKQIYFNV